MNKGTQNCDALKKSMKPAAPFGSMMQSIFGGSTVVVVVSEYCEKQAASLASKAVKPDTAEQQVSCNEWPVLFYYYYY